LRIYAFAAPGYAAASASPMPQLIGVRIKRLGSLGYSEFTSVLPGPGRAYACHTP
jgi:hypothetical protein